MARNSSRSDRFRRPAGSGTSTSGAGMSLVDFDERLRAQDRAQDVVEDWDKGGGGINLGLGRLWDEFSGAVPALVRLALPGSKEGEAGWADFGKGATSYVAGGLATLAEGVPDLVPDSLTPWTEPDEKEGGNRVVEGFKDFVGRTLDPENPEVYRPQSLRERASEAGLLPALVDTVGLVALAGGAATAPLKGASWAARATGRSAAAQRFMLRHANRINDPLVRAMQHPYRTAARALDRSWIQPGAARFNAAQGITDIADDAGDAARLTDDAAPLPDDLAAADEGLSTALDTARTNLTKYAEQEGLEPPAPVAVLDEAPAPEPPRPGDALAAALDRRLTGWRSHAEARRQTRLAEMEKDIAARSPAVRAGVRTAEDMVLRKAQEGGRRMTRQQASAMVGEEIHARYTGLKALETAYPNVPKDIWVRLGLRQNLIPDELLDPELEASLLGAVDLQVQEHARVREILESGRQGDTGLTGLADEDAITPGLTRRQTRELRNAQKMLERAESEVLARKEAREAMVREGRAAALEDHLGRLAEQKQALLDDDAAAVEAFDHSRAGKIRGFSTPERKAASIQAVYDRTLAEVEANGGWGGASYNPHTERFIVPGEDTGYAVGLVKGTARKVRLEEFTPDDIDLVVRAHQDVFQHPNVVVGTWVEDGWVYIDPSEIVTSKADAFVRAAAREQLSIFDVAKVDVPSGILRNRPDLADALLRRNHYMNQRAKEFEALVESSALTAEDFPAWLEMNLTWAAAAVDKGVVSHPDEFFQKFALKPAKKPSSAMGALRQIVVEGSLGGTPKQRLAMYRQMRAAVADADHAMAWYERSHELGERLFRNQPDVTLLDGTKINPADLFYQMLAVWSVNATPRDNLTKALRAFQIADTLPRKQFNALRQRMKKLVAGKITLEEAFGPDALTITKEFQDIGIAKQPREYMAEILAGRTIDKWDAEYLNEVPAPFGHQPKNLDRGRAVAWIRENYPDVIERIGEDAAVKEFYSRNHRAKIISFWDNLANPKDSLAVTMDAWMDRFYGTPVPDKQPVRSVRDEWLRYSEDVRETARVVSEATGQDIRPHQIQALMWVYAKDEVNRLRMGHFNAYAADAQDFVAKGIQITDEADPMLHYIDEAATPYETYDAKTNPRIEQRHRILNPDGTETVEPVVHRPAMGESKVSEVVEMWNKRRAKWLVTREQINASLAVGDTSGAQKHLDKFVTDMRTKTPKSGGLFDDAPGGDFLDIWEDPKFHSAGLIEHAAALQRLDVPLGKRLLQSFEGKVLGEFVPMADGARGAIRIFEDGNLATLVHEQGHLLRQILPEADMRAVEQVYGIEPGQAWPVAAEERWANDLTKFMVSEKAPKGLGPAFHKVREALSSIWQYVKGSFERGRIHPDLKPVFDSWFEPALREIPGNLSIEGRKALQAYGVPQRLWGEFVEVRVPVDEAKQRIMSSDPDLVRDHGTWDNYHEWYRTNVGLPDHDSMWPAIEARTGTGEWLEDGWHRVHSYIAQGASEIPVLRRMQPDPYPGMNVAPETGTLRQRAARPPKMPQPPNKSGDFYQAGRKGQAALARLEKNAMKRRALTVAEQKTQKALDDIRTVLAEGRLPSTMERDALRAKAGKIMERVNNELATPSVSRTPTRWQPLWHAVQDIAKEAETNPALADMLPDLPETLYEVQRLALEQGFDPVHFREFTPTQVRRLVWGNMRLGKGGDLTHEAAAGTRRTRTGQLRRQRGVDKSLEAFYAATVEAIAEKRTNGVIDWVETNAAKQIQQGAEIPEGWVLWDPVRTYLLTGTELSEDGLRQIQTAADHVTIVPESVSKTLYRFSKDYDHWSVRAIRKVTSPWRTLVLTFSPGWYVRNIVGNIMLAESEGVTLRDWKAAWRSAKTKDEIGRFADIPFVSSHTLADEAGLMADSSLIPRTLADAQVESGNLRGTAQHTMRAMLRANEVVDEFARAAVYHQGIRLNMTPEQAWTRAKTALVDYSALSGFERSVVRSVIPFYAWQKGILKVVMNQAIDHPARTSLLMLLGQMQEDYTADLLGVEPQDVPDFYKQMVGDRNVRSFNPFADPAEITTPEGIMRSLNPFLEIAIRKGLGAPEFYTDERRVGFFGTPQQDVNVPSEFGQLVTRSPGGRIATEGPGNNFFGITPSQVDLDALRSRLLKTRETVRGIPNPETEQRQGLLPTRS